MQRFDTSVSRLFSLLVAAALVLTLGACDDDSNPVGPDEEDDQPLEVLTVEDLPADPDDTGEYTYFSLRDGEIVLRYDETERDAAESTDWDIAFQGTTVIVNGGVSGPGEGAAYVAEAAFDEVAEVDLDRLQVDSEEGLAIPTGSENGWYIYNAEGQHFIRPLPGRTIVVRTADGEGYAKIRILSYYRGNPELPADRDEHPGRYYTFDYVIQTDGSTSLE